MSTLPIRASRAVFVAFLAGLTLTPGSASLAVQSVTPAVNGRVETQIPSGSLICSPSVHVIALATNGANWVEVPLSCVKREDEGDRQRAFSPRRRMQHP